MLKSTDDNILIWHDLATCYLSHACRYPKDSESEKLVERTLTVAHHCTTHNPSHWQHWNLLGNAAFYKSNG